MCRFWRTPCSSGGGYYYDRERKGEYRCIECEVWRDHYKDYYYAISLACADFDPNLEEAHCSSTYQYDMDKGGKLTINGKAMEFSYEKRLLALGPFGRMEEIVLSPAEQKVACSADAHRIWNEIVLKRLYKRQGKTKAGVPIGYWTYSDIDGRLAYEGSYENGERDGKWCYYYPDGKIRAEVVYRLGEMDGRWRYFDDQGRLKKIVEWKNHHPVGQSVRQAGLHFWEERTPTTISGGSK